MVVTTRACVGEVLELVEYTYAIGTPLYKVLKAVAKDMKALGTEGHLHSVSTQTAPGDESRFVLLVTVSVI
jgi:hypothetical protein